MSESRKRKALPRGNGVWCGQPWVGAGVESHFRPHLRILPWQRRASCWHMGSLDGVDFVLGLQGSLPQAGPEDDLHIQAV